MQRTLHASNNTRVYSLVAITLKVKRITAAERAIEKKFAQIWVFVLKLIAIAAVSKTAAAAE